MRSDFWQTDLWLILDTFWKWLSAFFLAIRAYARSTNVCTLRKRAACRTPADIWKSMWRETATENLSIQMMVLIKTWYTECNKKWNMALVRAAGKDLLLWSILSTMMWAIFNLLTLHYIRQTILYSGRELFLIVEIASYLRWKSSSWPSNCTRKSSSGCPFVGDL